MAYGSGLIVNQVQTSRFRFTSSVKLLINSARYRQTFTVRRADSNRRRRAVSSRPQRYDNARGRQTYLIVLCKTRNNIVAALLYRGVIGMWT